MVTLVLIWRINYYFYYFIICNKLYFTRPDINENNLDNPFSDGIAMLWRGESRRMV